MAFIDLFSGWIQQRAALLIKAFWDEEHGLAASSAAALRKIGDRAALPELEWATEEMDDFPFFRIGKVLYQLGSEKAEECFPQGLASDRYTVRAACVSDLGKLKTESSVTCIIQTLKDGHESVRRAAVLALMDNDSSRAVNALTGMLDDEDVEVRMCAKEALRRMRKR